MTTIEVEIATWEGIDARLATLQVEVRYGVMAQQGKRIFEELAALRADLAALRAVERAQRGTPVVTRFLEPAEPAELTSIRPEPTSNLPPPSPLTTGREQMIDRGFTGNFCPDCGSARMIRTGTCETCQDCGANTGCS